MKFFRYVLVLTVMALLFSFCHQKKETPASSKLISFDLSDSVMVDELMRFYLDSNMITPEYLVCDHEKNGGLHSFECISEAVEFCAPGYMQDSLHGTFFQEIGVMTGTSGENNIYICEKNATGYHILFQTLGQIETDNVPENEMINGYHVIYFRSEEIHYRIVFDGKGFVVENVNQNLITAK